jgi:hypothetical protein
MLASFTRPSLCVAVLALAVSVGAPKAAKAQRALTLEQAWAECLRQVGERGYTGPDYQILRGPALNACIASFGHNP